MKLTIVAIGFLVTALLAGCSATLPQSTPAESMKSFYSARQAGKFDVACENFIDPILEQRMPGDLCLQYFQEHPIPAGEITVDVAGLEKAQTCSGFDVPSLYVGSPLVNGQSVGESWCMTQRNGKWLFGPVS